MSDKFIILWRQRRLARQGDLTSPVVSPAAALSVADCLLARVAVAEMHHSVWLSWAAEPLAAVLLAAGPAGTGRGMAWVRPTVSGLLREDTDGQVWVDACAAADDAATRHVQTPHWVGVLARVRQLDERQRLSLTAAMAAAVELDDGPGTQPQMAGVRR